MTRRFHPIHVAFACLFVLSALFAAGPAFADDTISRPGDHPKYAFELEPHVLLGWDTIYPGSSYGIGGRVSIPLVQNGFVPTINNSVAISFGVDAMFYNACWYHQSCSATYLDFPVTLQWNFFVAQRWSVFGEPGLMLYHGFFNDCPAGSNCPGEPEATGIYPVIYLGGRYHLSNSVSLTARIGFPTFSFGGSFFL